VSARAPAGERARGALATRLPGGADARFVLALTVLCGVLGAVAPPGPARVAAGLLLCLALPGYALSALAFARRGIARAELLLCTLGGSLVVAALGGLLLDAAPGHMGRGAWAILLSFVTVLALAGAALDGSGPTPARPEPAVDERPRRAAWRPLADVCLGALALGLALAAVAVARHGADRAAGFSELSALPVSSSAVPRMLIRVKSHEHSAVGLRVTLSEDARRLSTTYRTLLPGEEWKLVSRPLRAGARRAIVRVYRAAEPRAFLHTVYYLPAGLASTSRPLGAAIGGRVRR